MVGFGCPPRWAKNDAEGIPADQFDRGADYGFADADRRHRLTISGIVQTFAGMQASGIMQYQSSLSFNMTAGRDLNRDGVANDRPPGVTRNQGCRDLNLDLVNDYRVANRLEPVTRMTCGDYLTFDFQVSRAFSLGGSRRLEAMFQVFNALNRSNFFPPVGNALSPLLAQSLEVASPRQAELAVRYTF